MHLCKQERTCPPEDTKQRPESDTFSKWDFLARSAAQRALQESLQTGRRLVCQYLRQKMSIENCDFPVLWMVYWRSLDGVVGVPSFDHYDKNEYYLVAVSENIQKGFTLTRCHSGYVLPDPATDLKTLAPLLERVNYFVSILDQG